MAGNATGERDGPCARQSWTAWTVSEATLRQVPNQAEGVVELRCGITCPHCNAVFFVPASSMPKNKGFYCKAHLRSSSCVPVPQSQASQQDGPAPTEEAAGTSTAVEVAQKPPSKRSRTNASLHRHCQEQLATVNERLNSLETEALENRRRWALLGQLFMCSSDEPRVVTETGKVHITCLNDIKRALKLHVMTDVKLVPSELERQLSLAQPRSIEDDVRLQFAQRRAEALEREVASLRDENKRLRSGDELVQQQRITAMYQRRFNAAQKFIGIIDRQLKGVVGEMVCTCVNACVTDALNAIRAAGARYRSEIEKR